MKAYQNACREYAKQFPHTTIKAEIYLFVTETLYFVGKKFVLTPL